MKNGRVRQIILHMLELVEGHLRRKSLAHPILNLVEVAAGVRDVDAPRDGLIMLGPLPYVHGDVGGAPGNQRQRSWPADSEEVRA